MARQADWNKSFWTKLDKLENIDDKPIVHIIQDELNKVESVMVQKTPRRYGGLLASHYAVLVQTDNGYSGRVGYTNQQHINLDPVSPGYDNFTNPELMEMLIDKNKTSNDVLDISDAMESFRENCKDRIKDYWKGVIND